MAGSRAWIESRHLRDSVDGARALAVLDRLPEDLRRSILERGDAAAAQSVSLAHAFVVQAAGAAETGDEVYRVWEELLADVTQDPAASRDITLAFLKLEPGAVAGWSDEVRREWSQTVRALAARSRRLATAFLEAAAKSSPDAAPAAPLIEAWRDAAFDLLARGGWRSEFLAEALLASSSRLMPLLDAGAVDAWAELIATIGTAGRSPKPPEVPPALTRLSPRAASSAMMLCAGAAYTSAAHARRMLEVVPALAACVGEDLAVELLALAAAAVGDEGLPDAIALLPGILHGVPAIELPILLSHARSVGEHAPAMLCAYLRTMDRAIEQGGRDGVALWVERGLELAGNHREAALAHFHLESRTSHKLLVERSAAVSFEEVEGMLRRYLTMMSRRSFQLSAAPGLWMRPPLAGADDPALRLPERIDLFATFEDNQALYKIIASHIAGRYEYGTYAFDLDELERRGWTPPCDEDGSADQDPGARDVAGFLARFPNPLLASALFVMLDGVRIDAALGRDFPGLRGELARLGRDYAATIVPGAQDRYDERLLDALFHLSVGCRQVTELEPRLRAQGEFLVSSVELLRAPEASVYDSASLTIAYYGSLAFAEARGGDGGDGDEVDFTDMGGATVVDPFEHLEGGARGENTAPWRPDPTRALADQTAETGLKLELSDDDGMPPGAGRPLSLEELRSMLERGGDLKITEAQGSIEEGLGLYITDLLGKVPADQLRALRDKIASGDVAAIRAWLTRQAAGGDFFYDEWDHRIGDYRRRWCRLHELDGEEDAGEYFAQALDRSDELVQQIKRDFQLLRPQQLRRVPRMEHGEEFDLNALVEAHADRRTRRTPSDRLYVARKPEERDVATLFLIDMSASTDEPLPLEAAATGPAPRRVIDLTKDTLVVLAQVLEEMGDAYSIYGFSGHGRDNVEVYQVKSFAERLSDKVKGRLGGIRPKRSTRMGAALRHAGEKLARTTARARHLILLSDGFPQDFDYGDDRRSNVYGIRDTMQALRELEKRGMQTFCITVDPAGHDYLGDMCPTSRYAIIDDITELPRELVRIYRRITHA
ncbi:MAG: hypothetical protein HY899_00205 [Deltaproteobacteria bacterium]|nr:hypothetical protein [Deltaproteobacteria bacterium]